VFAHKQGLLLGGGEYLGVADLLIAPYLPLSTRTDVGSWTLVPFGSLEESGVVPDDLKHPVERLVDAYRPTDNRGGAMGVVAVPEAGFGESFERAAMGMVGYALLAGVVTANQPLEGRARCRRPGSAPLLARGSTREPARADPGAKPQAVEVSASPSRDARRRRVSHRRERGDGGSGPDGHRVEPVGPSRGELER
jgi:hypothetical protein